MNRIKYDHAPRALSQAVRCISPSSWRTCLLRLFALTVFIGTLPLTSVFAATFTVTNLNDSGSGSLRDAIATANGTPGDDRIVFPSGLSGTITLTTGELTIANNGSLSIDGEGRITVSGNDASRVFSINGGVNASLNSLTITQGFAGFSGGGIFNSGTLTIINSTISDNAAAGSDSDGGGIFNEFGTLMLDNSTFSDNSAGDLGGGISILSGTVTITNSTFSDNSARIGGGIAINRGTMTISNSTFNGNSALGGGGIFTDMAPPAPQVTITNSTISDNSSGILNAGEMTIANTIVANNSDYDCGIGGGGVNTRNSLIEDGRPDCLLFGTNINNLTGDPSLGALTGSPAYFPLLAACRRNP